MPSWQASRPPRRSSSHSWPATSPSHGPNRSDVSPVVFSAKAGEGCRRWCAQTPIMQHCDCAGCCQSRRNLSPVVGDAIRYAHCSVRSVQKACAFSARRGAALRLLVREERHPACRATVQSTSSGHGAPRCSGSLPPSRGRLGICDCQEWLGGGARRSTHSSQKGRLQNAARARRPRSHTWDRRWTRKPQKSKKSPNLHRLVAHSDERLPCFLEPAYIPR